MGAPIRAWSLPANPALHLAFRKRERLEAYIDALIGLLDGLDGDTDGEPDTDAEPDADGEWSGDENEPSLAAPEPRLSYRSRTPWSGSRSSCDLERDKLTSQVGWCRGTDGDCEYDGDEAEQDPC